MINSKEEPKKTNSKGSKKRPRVSAEKPIHPEPSPGKKFRKNPLAGKLFSVSTLVQASSADEKTENYKSVVALCESGGAACTPQVHKKVFCVVATGSAIQAATQRVRKAWKKGIPVVKLEWVKDCLVSGKLLAFGDYRVSMGAAKPKSETSKKDVSAPSKATNVADSPIDMTERTVALGCCCVCHETGETANCEWCVDCVAPSPEEEAPSNATNVVDPPIDMAERTVNLGCCCVCHENGTAANCEWCVDCV